MTTVGSAKALTAALLRAAKMPDTEANRCAEAIVTADIWGVASHGLMRLPYYLARLLEGGYAAGAQLHTVRDTGPLLAFDGAGGLGHAQLWEAAELATERAGQYGIAAASVGNSGHCGALGVYTLPMIRAGRVGLVFSNGPAVMPPWQGRSPVLSTSPLAFGFPVDGAHAIVDLATSAVARGKIAAHARSGEPLPEGWAVDADGNPTTDATAALHGMLAPLGGAKGFALAFAVEALSGGLVGGLSGDVVDMFAPSRAAEPQGVAHLVLAVDPQLVSPTGDPAERLHTLAESVTDAGGRIPGAGKADPAGVPDDRPLQIAADVRTELAGWAERLGVTVDDTWA